MLGPSSSIAPVTAQGRPVHVVKSIWPRAVMVPLDSLLPADSPRLHGENREHVHLLAATEGGFPPILVQRRTMRVVDGMHRVQAAHLRGDEEILAELFDGTDQDAFLCAVRLNVAHGMPLSRGEREAAAIRIITTHAQWSDRAIAAATGLSAPTISAIRRRSAEHAGDRNAEEQRVRVGQDGRVRPLSTAEGRLRASRLIAEQPEASLREIARESGISVGTARDVRERVRRGESPVPSKYAAKPKPVEDRPPAVPENGRPAPVTDPESNPQWHRLRRDPSLRLTESGRFLLRLLGIQTVSAKNRREIVFSVPEHCRAAVAELAQGCSEWWGDLAREIAGHETAAD
jgi:ParB-like chromosome segregation protein Spo0J